MELFAIDRNVALKEWHGFIKYGTKLTHLKDDVIESWERSKELNVDPFSGRSNVILSVEEIKQKLRINRNLINISKPYMQKIYNILKGLGYIVFLTDDVGNIIHIIGDKDVRSDFKEKLNFSIGVAWSEEAVGTTAVSMAITNRQPVPFMAEEKYCFELKKRACSAVPINNINGDMIGILGIAASFSQPNEKFFGVLLGAEMAIENQLRMNKVNNELTLISSYYKTMFNSVSDAIVIVNCNGDIVNINNKAKDILGTNNNQIIGRRAKDVLEFYPVIMNVLNTGSEYNNNQMLDTKNEKFHYKIQKSIPIKGKTDTVDGCISILKEIGKKDVKKAKYTFDDIIGDSVELKKVIKEAKVASNNNMCNILITGKSGVGKEVFAQAIHNRSNRWKFPFIAVNCGAIPKNLIESELFGYEGGSFTGADRKGRPGKFESAKHGTIFLDEIGEMPKTMQIRLLRVIQEKEIMRIGGNKSIDVDARVIAATNKNLYEEVRKGNFREDLFWRLNVISIHIPTLAERREDIALLIEYYLNKNKDKTYKMDKQVKKILLNYDWPGNVRELKNVIERATAFTSTDKITTEHLPRYIMERKILFNDKYLLEKTEKDVIKQVLLECDGNISKASKRLGISRPTLYKKLGKLE